MPAKGGGGGAGKFGELPVEIADRVEAASSGDFSNRGICGSQQLTAFHDAVLVQVHKGRNPRHLAENSAQVGVADMERICHLRQLYVLSVMFVDVRDGFPYECCRLFRLLAHLAQNCIQAVNILP